MRLSELQSKKVINIVTGSNIGNIIDVDINNDGKVESFVIDQGRVFFSLNRESDIEIFWNEITKIGEDVILIKKG